MLFISYACLLLYPCKFPKQGFHPDQWACSLPINPQLHSISPAPRRHYTLIHPRPQVP